MESLENCPICEQTEQKDFLKCPDNTGSKEEFQIVECTSCGFKFTNPRPNEQEVGAYYESEDYISHTNSSEGLFNKVYQSVRNYTIDQKQQLLLKHSPKGKMLDYGCGTGEFLAFCKDKGWDTIGFEPGESARKHGIENYGVDLLDESQLEQVQKESLDVITMWHVLEHVHRLKPTIENLKSLLKPGGTLIVAVPNMSCYDAKVYDKYWAAYDVPRHIYHFTPPDISKLFGQFDMNVVEVLPMRFDSFYVSMLSEKYKGGNIISAALTGLRSNLLASNKVHTWSSQIYVLAK